MWRLIDKEMSLKECSIYCYSPEDDPYDGEEGAIWSFNFFFFNKARKRVCYIYLRGLSILSHSPGQKTPLRTKREADGDWSMNEPSSSKRAKYWFGDKIAANFSTELDEDEDEDVIEPWENDGVTATNLLDDLDEPKYKAIPNERETQSANHLASNGSSSGSSITATPSISSPSTKRGCSKSTVRDMSEDVAELIDI